MDKINQAILWEGIPETQRIFQARLTDVDEPVAFQIIKSKRAYNGK